MRKSVLFLFVVMLTAILSGCILSKTPNTNDVTMTLGEQKPFSVNVFPSNATYTWTLNEVPLTNTGKSYVYTALGGNHTLVVKAKHALGTDTQTWNITCKSILSGTVTVCGGGPLFGVTMTLSGTSTGTVTTDTSGNYTFSGLANGNYTITPSLSPGWTFDPVSSSKIVNGANLTGVNITASTNSAMLWPLHIGDRYVYKYSDYTGANSLHETIITGTSIIDSRNFFTTNSSLCFGSTENSIYGKDEGDIGEIIIPPIPPIIVSVTVPFGTFDAYQFCKYFTYPCSYECQYIVRGLGFVKSSEFNYCYQPTRWWEWGDLVDFIPGPDCR